MISPPRCQARIEAEKPCGGTLAGGGDTSKITEMLSRHASN
jgi:hypothetical protein